MTMKIYEFQSYKKFVLAYIDSLDRSRGELAKIARALNIHSATLSQVLNGQKNFNLEQATELAIYLGLDYLETEFLHLLVSFERAGTEKLKQHLLKRQETLKREASDKRSFQSTPNEILTDKIRTQFYSSWEYTGLAVLSSIPGKQTVEAIIEHTGLSRQKINEVLNFLVEHGICQRSDNKIIPGLVHTHLGSDDALINTHRLNWRLKGMQRFNSFEAGEFAFSGPMSLTHSDFKNVRSKLDQLISETVEIAMDSEAEVATCLNIDWFKF